MATLGRPKAALVITEVERIELVRVTMIERAASALTAGHSVIADAVHATAGDREAIAALARRIGVPFIGLWLDGPREILATRLRDRVADASDATPDVLHLQLRTDIGPLDWHRLDGSRDAEEVQQSTERLIASAPASIGPPLA